MIRPRRRAEGEDALVPRTGAGAGSGEHTHKYVYRRGMPTPSPLRRLEDPVADHVLPSRKEQRAAARALMPPPAARAPKRPRGQAAPAETLDEDTFVEAMGEIIERDFFPELPRLQRQMKWLEALEARRLRSLTEVRRAVQQSELRHHMGGGGGGQTPLVGGGGGGGSSGASVSETASVAGTAASEAGALPLSLDQFLARFQSEDDASFDVLADKMREAHRRKYWWVYEHPAIESGKEKLYLLPSGDFMSEAERRKHVEASNAKPRLGDDRPNAPETWTYRAKNALMFGAPDLEETSKVHTKPGAAAALGVDGPLLLENGGAAAMGSGGGAMIVAPGGNARVGQAAKAPKAVVHSNTRFTAEDRRGVGLMPSPLERLATDVSSFSTETSASAEQAAANDTFVPMTPLLIPGADGDVPIMTWGEVDSTPMRVSEPFDAAEEAATAAARGFRIQAQSRREKLASALEAKARKKSSYSAKRSPAPTGIGNGTPAAGAAMGARKLAGVRSLTPAAQSLAAKIAGTLGPQGGGGSGSAFGGGATSQLRASYGASAAAASLSTRAASAARAAGGGGGGGGVTPSPSPMRAAPKRATAAAGAGKAAAAGGRAKASSSGGGVTENLLNI